MHQQQWMSLGVGLVAVTVSYLLFPDLQRQLSAYMPFSLSFLRHDGFECVNPGYAVRIVSYEPFIAHLEGFLTNNEGAELTRLVSPDLQPSRVKHPNGSLSVSPVRDSKTAKLDKGHSVVKCLAERATALQGHVPVDGVNVQATFYGPGGHFVRHHDAGHESLRHANNDSTNNTLFRATTIFGILDADCEHCGTTFPLLPFDRSAVDARMCDFLDCEMDVLTVKAVKGSAVFFRNYYSNGSIDNRLQHAAQKLENGYKHGLNIWTTA